MATQGYTTDFDSKISNNGFEFTEDINSLKNSFMNVDPWNYYVIPTYNKDQTLIDKVGYFLYVTKNGYLDDYKQTGILKENAITIEPNYPFGNMTLLGSLPIDGNFCFKLSDFFVNYWEDDIEYNGRIGYNADINKQTITSQAWGYGVTPNYRFINNMEFDKVLMVPFIEVLIFDNNYQQVFTIDDTTYNSKAIKEFKRYDLKAWFDDNERPTGVEGENWIITRVCYGLYARTGGKAGADPYKIQFNGRDLYYLDSYPGEYTSIGMLPAKRYKTSNSFSILCDNWVKHIGEPLINNPITIDIFNEGISMLGIGDSTLLGDYIYGSGIGYATSRALPEIPHSSSTDGIFIGKSIRHRCPKYEHLCQTLSQDGTIIMINGGSGQISSDPDRYYYNYCMPVNFILDAELSEEIVLDLCSTIPLAVCRWTNTAIAVVKINDGSYKDLADDNILIPTVNKDGTIGKYKKGQEGVSDPNSIANKTTSSLPPTDITDPDTNNYVTEIDLNEPGVTAFGTFSTWYALSKNDILNLANFLFTADPTSIKAIKDGLALFGENPMNFLLRLYQVPFNPIAHMEHNTGEITFGNGVRTGVMAEEITKPMISFDLGSATFRRYFNNFLDFEPYTTAKLYVPYCDEVSLPTSIFVGSTIKVKLIVDLISGSCLGVVYRNGIPYTYTHGSLVSEIQITGENATQYAVNFKNYMAASMSNLTNVVSSGIGAVSGQTSGGGVQLPTASQIGISNQAQNARTMQDARLQASSMNSGSSGGMSGVVNGVINQASMYYDFMMQPTALEMSGNSTGYINMIKPQKCYIIETFSQPLSKIPDNYGEVIGYACMESGIIGDYSGFIQCTNANVQPPNATAPETAEINELLNSGVWV